VTEDTDLDRLFTRLSTERRRPAPDDHPAPEKLSAYLANELSPEEDDAIQEHLTACTLCTGLLLDLQRFLDPPEEDRPREGVADFESAAEWRELKGRMGGRVEGGGGGRLPRSSPFRSIFGSVRVWQGVAAVLAVGVVGMGRYSLKLQEESRSPEANSIYLSLPSSLGVRGGGEWVKTAKLRGKAKTIMLVLAAPPNLDYKEYQAKITSKRTLKTNVINDLVRQDDAFVITLHPGSSQPGTYTVEVDGFRNGQPETVGTYEFRIDS
jgi:hypothetical protein